MSSDSFDLIVIGSGPAGEEGAAVLDPPLTDVSMRIRDAS
jgi:pyruvate/2-oxoglutarate dehydrogenase complex dihydrolipoamide dehydrogenase (E3) component